MNIVCYLIITGISDLDRERGMVMGYKIIRLTRKNSLLFSGFLEEVRFHTLGE